MAAAQVPSSTGSASWIEPSCGGRLAELGMALSAEEWTQLRQAGLDEEALPDDVRPDALSAV